MILSSASFSVVPQVSNDARYPHMLSNLMAAVLLLYSLYVSIFYTFYIPEKYFESSLSAAPTLCNIVHIVYHIYLFPVFQVFVSTTQYVSFVFLFTLREICHQQSLREGVGSGRSATGTPWDTAEAWRERRFPPWCRRWSWEWTRLSGGCCSRNLPGQHHGMGPPQMLCGIHRALQMGEWDFISVTIKSNEQYHYK